MSDLHQHSVWLQKLAVRLAGAGPEAQDAVQETWAAALASPPRDRAALPAWLARVLRNFLGSSARRDANRRTRDREFTSALAEGVPSPEDLLARHEALAALAEEVRALAQPYRDVVLLCYAEGLSPQQIAQQRGVPAGTVRWRLKTGLDLLRGRLAERLDGDLKRFALAIGVRAAGPTPELATGGSWAKGAFLMKKLQAAIAALILAAALMAAFVFWRGSQTPDSDPVGPGSVRTSSSTVAAPGQRQDESGHNLPTTHGSPADPGPGGAAGGSTNARTPADLPRVAPAIGAVAPTSGREIPNWAKAPGLPDRTVAGRVVGADRPIPGARLRLSPGMLTHARELDQHALAGRDGAFTFAAVAPTNWFLTVAAQNFAPRVLSVDLRTASPVVRPTLEAPDRLVIRLAPCRLFVRGTVRDSERGLVPTARVKITRLWDNGGTSVEARDGRYELCLPDIDGTEYVLVAEADGYGSVETSAAFNESRVIDFALGPQARVRGIAAQPTSGEAQAAVKITLRPAPPADPDRPPIGRTQPIRRETLTGDDGRFELAGLVPGRYSVGVASDDFIAKDKGRTIDLRPGDNEITVELAQKTERAGMRN